MTNTWLDINVRRLRKEHPKWSWSSKRDGVTFKYTGTQTDTEDKVVVEYRGRRGWRVHTRHSPLAIPYAEWSLQVKL